MRFGVVIGEVRFPKLCVLLLLLLLLCICVHSSPSSQMEHGNLDFSNWDIILQNCVTRGTINGIELNIFDYKKLKEDSTLMGHLSNFTLQIQNANTTHFNQSEHLAFWINVYNFFAVNSVLDSPCQRDLFGDCRPLESIRQVGQQQPSIIYTIWNLPIMSVGGSTAWLSLNDVESKLKTPSSNPSGKMDARVHGCIVSASIGCPDLRPSAYTVQEIDQQMSNSTILFLQNPKKGANLDGKTVQLSSIWKWVGAEFSNETSNFDTVLSLVRQYGPRDIAIFLSNNSNPSISYMDYDWGVNGDIDQLCTVNRACFPWWALLCLLLAVLILAIVVAVCVRRKMTSNYYPLN